jgi:hypothetical protein
LPSICYASCPTYTVTKSDGSPLPIWATFNAAYTSGETNINTSLLTDFDIGTHEFKFIKHSIDIPSVDIEIKTFTVIVCKYDYSTGIPVIPNPVYIEDI